jgi:hypothetical protein
MHSPFQIHDDAFVLRMIAEENRKGFAVEAAAEAAVAALALAGGQGERAQSHSQGGPFGSG